MLIVIVAILFLAHSFDKMIKFSMNALCRRKVVMK